MSTDARKVAAPGRPVGIKDIARALGISTGTVDRALHAKPGVNALTRARVLSMAESLGYRPNLAARYLSSRKTVRISVQLPQEIALFWDSLREGILEAAAPFAPALQVEFRTYPHLGDGDIPPFDEALHDGTNGLIIAPGNPVSLTPHLRKAARQNIPVVCVVTDAPEELRLTSVSADPFTVGAVAGELLAARFAARLLGAGLPGSGALGAGAALLGALLVLGGAPGWIAIGLLLLGFLAPVVYSLVYFRKNERAGELNGSRSRPRPRRRSSRCARRPRRRCWARRAAR